jgi:hypothetical protein
MLLRFTLKLTRAGTREGHEKRENQRWIVAHHHRGILHQRRSDHRTDRSPHPVRRARWVRWRRWQLSTGVAV